MALTVSEAHAVNTILHWLGAPNIPGAGRPGDPAALDALELLRRKAYNVLSAGVAERELREAFALFTAPQPPLVGAADADALTVAHCGDDDGRDVVIVANTAVIPSVALLELNPLDALDIGAQMIVSAREALDAQKWGES